MTAAIAGPRTQEQWEDYLAALDYRFTAEDEALVDRLVTPGHPSTPGYNDPAYPLEGRRPAQRLMCWTPAPAMRARFAPQSMRAQHARMPPRSSAPWRSSLSLRMAA